MPYDMVDLVLVRPLPHAEPEALCPRSGWQKQVIDLSDRLGHTFLHAHPEKQFHLFDIDEAGYGRHARHTAHRFQSHIGRRWFYAGDRFPIIACEAVGEVEPT